MSDVQSETAAAVPTEVEVIGPPRTRNIAWIVRLVSIVVVIGGWEIFGRHVNPLFMSYPSAIAQAAVGLITSGELFTALQSSLRTLLLGFVTASVIGVVLGLLIGRYRMVDAATDWLVNALYATPLVAVIPLVTLWFGL
ncbi:MAG TPA: hypothetical protein VMU59_07505, partial [Caulobacteraceae bacterium]|nr:hypothetical protein [Caulobacteraceae bacterium]